MITNPTAPTGTSPYSSLDTTSQKVLQEQSTPMQRADATIESVTSQLDKNGTKFEESELRTMKEDLRAAGSDIIQAAKKQGRGLTVDEERKLAQISLLMDGVDGVLKEKAVQDTIANIQAVQGRASPSIVGGEIPDEKASFGSVSQRAQNLIG